MLGRSGRSRNCHLRQGTWPPITSGLQTLFGIPTLAVRVFRYNQNGMANLITNSTDAASVTEAGAEPSPSAACKKLLEWLVAVAFFMKSLDTTGMNTLAYADLTEPQTNNGSSIASTMQKLSISFGVATAGLTTAVFVPNLDAANSTEMIYGLHTALLLLGLVTILSSGVFRSLKRSDGSNVSSQKLLHHG